MAKKRTHHVSAGADAAPCAHVAFSRPDYVIGAVTALVALAVYLPMLNTTVTGEDSGDFITAAYTLGIPHPPGYPLWCMLAKLFTLIPVSTIAWRVSAMSAFWGAATAGIVSLIIIRLTRNRLAALAGGLAVAFSFELWEQSTIAEVYSLNAFFVVSSVLILIVWQENRHPKLLYAFAALYGLGVSNHPTMALLGPVFALFILSLDRQPWLRWRLYVSLPMVALLFWGLVHIYLPVRAATGPYLNWGDPVTWDRFWDLVLRRQYDYPGVSDTPRSFQRIAQEFGVLLPMYKTQYTVWLAALPLLGLYPLWKSDRRRCLFIVGIFLYLNVAFGVYLNSNVDDDALWIISTFFIPAHVMAGIVMGVALDWLARIKPAQLAAAVWCLYVAVPIVPLITNYKANDRSQDYYAYDYGMNILNTMDENAIFFATTDEATFPVMYLQAVERLRPDVTFANKTGFPDESLYSDMPIEIRNSFSTPPTDEQIFFITDWVIAHTERPIYCNTMMTIEGLPGAKMVPEGLLYRLRRPDEPARETDWWSRYQWHHDMEQAPDPANMTASNVVSGYHYARGRELLFGGQTDAGLRALETAARLGGRRTSLLNDIARTCIDFQLYEAAIEYHEKALVLSPESSLALENLAKLHTAKGRHEQAIAYRLRLLDVLKRKYAPNDPRLAAAANDIAGAHYALGELVKTRTWLEFAIGIDEVHFDETPLFAARDLHNLSLVFFKQGDRQTATQYHNRAKEIILGVLGEEHPWAQRTLKGLFIYSNE